MADDRTLIDAEQFEKARRDPKVKDLAQKADAYAARMRAEGRMDLSPGEQQLFDLWKAAEQQLDRLLEAVAAQKASEHGLGAEKAQRVALYEIAEAVEKEEQR